MGKEFMGEGVIDMILTYYQVCDIIYNGKEETLCLRIS